MTDPLKVLFVCTGNQCRSPIAEALMKQQLQVLGKAEIVEVASAGVSAWEGMPAASGAQEAVKKFGASLNGFRSRILTPELCQPSHLVLVMETIHREYILEYFPKCADKTKLLGSYLQPPRGEIPDPVGGSAERFDCIAGWIDEAVRNLLLEWETVKARYGERKLVIALGADHRGYRVKEFLKDHLNLNEFIVMDCGTASEASCDHPDFAFKVSELVASEQADRGILVCATGHGMLMSANKVPGIRAVFPVNIDHAKLSRTHNNANVLTLGADFMDRDKIQEIVDVWLHTGFLGGKYQARINKITAYENSVHPWEEPIPCK